MENQITEDYSSEVIRDNLRPTSAEYMSDPFEETPIDPELQILPDREPLPPFVLGRVKGIFMGPFGVINGNNRIYLPEIVDSILADPYIVQMMSNKCLLGEAHHPGDKRSSLWLDQAAISVTKLWKEGVYLMGEADILDTPNGRIVWTLVKYGSKLGVSARASGKGVKGTYRGQRAEIIKPENYELKGFDVVLNPGFAAARPDFNSTNEESYYEESSLHDELKSLITESKVDNDLVRGLINYTEDESLKDLLPLLEDASTVGDVDTSAELTEENETLKNQVASLKVLIDSLREECLRPNADCSDIVEELIGKYEEQSSKRMIAEEQVDELMSLIEEKSLSHYNDITALREEHEEELDGIQLMIQEDFNHEKVELLESYDEKVASLEEELVARDQTISDYVQQIESLNEEIENLRSQIIIQEESEEGFDLSFLNEEEKPEAPAISIPKKIDMTSSILSVVNEEQQTNSGRVRLINSIKLGGK